MENLQAPSQPQSTASSPTLKLEAARCAKILLGCYRTGDANDPDVYVASAISVLGEYPVEVIRQVCDPRLGLPAKSKWLPTVFEIKAACEAAMAPLDRRRREEELADERRRALSAPTLPRPSLDELRAKHGENWGLHPHEFDKKRSAGLTLDDMCRQAGISREDFEAINAKAEEAQRAFVAGRFK